MVAPYWLNSRPGVWPAMSVTSSNPRFCRSLAPNAVIEVPTSCRFCSRRCAVTVISSSVAPPVSCAGAGIARISPRHSRANVMSDLCGDCMVLTLLEWGSASGSGTGAGAFGHPAAFGQQRSTVHDQRLSGDVGGRVGGEEYGRRGDIFRTTQAAERNAPLEGTLVLVAPEVGGRRRFDHSRLYAVD